MGTSLISSLMLLNYVSVCRPSKILVVMLDFFKVLTNVASLQLGFILKQFKRRCALLSIFIPDQFMLLLVYGWAGLSSFKQTVVIMYEGVLLLKSPANITSHQIGFECFALSLYHMLTSSQLRVCLSWG